MEKDKLDACYPTAILEDFFRSSETETTSSDSEESHQNPKKLGFFELIRTRSMRSLPKLHPLSVLKLSRRERGRSRRESRGDMAIVDDDSCCFKSQWKKNFTFSELQIATKNFNQENLIGKGGYAEVYKGCLGSGKIVAIKRLIRGTLEERIGDFLSEIGIMAHVDHPNTAKLIGYGVEGGMHLVLEFLPHGSLASLLHGLNEKIEWSIRYKVALGTSEGLLYLHEGCKRRIIHRDIKAANILLTKDFEPQICDFGLAKWLPEQWTQHVISNFEGTFGYLAPEFLMHGIVDEKTDVFAFGVLLLELITRRRALDYSQQSLVLWAKPLIYKNKIRELVDPSLAGAYDTQQMNLMLLAASLCIKQSSIRRPQMSQVVQILRGNLGCLEDMKIRRMPFLRKLFEKQLFDGEDYSLIEDSNHSNRLHQLKKLAFEV